MVDISGLLDRKYNIQQQQATAATTSANASANLENTQAAIAPSDAAARQFQERGAGSASFGQGDYERALATSEPGKAFAQDQLSNSTTALNQYQLAPAAGGVLQQLLQRLHQGQQPQPVQGYNKGTTDVMEYSDGTNKVPGQGDGTVDKVPSMLAPGEAVLNRAAAEHLGRHTIGLLNALGEQKMGMSPAGQDPTAAGGVPGYATGSSGVGIDPVPGQGGTWGPSGDATGASGNTALRAGLGLGVPRPGPTTPVKAFASGTSDVPSPDMNRAVAKNNTKLMNRIDNSEMTDQFTDRSAAKIMQTQQGQPMGEMADLKRAMPGYAKGTAEVPGKGKVAAKGKEPSKGAPKPGKAGPAMGAGGAPMPPTGEAPHPAVLAAVAHLMSQQPPGGGGLPMPGPGLNMPMPPVGR